MSKSLRRLVLSTAVCGSLAVSYQAFAETPGAYGAWSDPNQAQSATSGDLKNLLADLKKLIAKAQKDRAANPVFLRDLNNLTARYENPWGKQVLFDDFKDGDYTRSPAWSVASGEYWVEQGYGLRNKITVASGTASAPAPSKKVSREQLAISILGAVLGGKKAATTPPPPAQVDGKPASISTRIRVPNAFSLTTDLSSWVGAGQFEIGLTQNTSGSGYRVAYHPGTNGAQGLLELVKVTSRGRGVIGSASIAALEDKRNHALAWTRNAVGQMSVLIDGKTAVSARDVSFRDAFSAVQLTNDAADVILKSITVLGAR